MRSLIYIPIIHEEADLGSLAAVANEKGLEICGESEWQNHQKTVALFWDRISDYFAKWMPMVWKYFKMGFPWAGNSLIELSGKGQKGEALITGLSLT